MECNRGSRFVCRFPGINREPCAHGNPRFTRLPQIPIPFPPVTYLLIFVCAALYPTCIVLILGPRANWGRVRRPEHDESTN